MRVDIFSVFRSGAGVPSPRTVCCLTVILFLCAPFCARAEPPLYEKREPVPASFSWTESILARVPVLTHARGTRLPMILWEPEPAGTLAPSVYKDLLARGLAQHLHMDEKMIPQALAMQQAGSPVIMMQGVAGQWPASEAGDPREWAHQFDAGYTPRDALHACPGITKGWRINAEKIRATLQKFKEAGVKVDAVWMDWEGDPLGGPERYDQALHCARCRATLPREALSGPEPFRQYCWRRYLELTGAYLAAPVAEIFPGCSTTNWRAAFSTIQHPIHTWPDQLICPSTPVLFTATNPVAYGNTLFFHAWKPEFTKDREHVDQFYTHLLLWDVSHDTANRLLFAPHRDSVPWVCRWCPDDENPEIPIMSRERYREVLRHLWLRGVTAMQIFNPRHEGHETVAIGEVQDAVTVYDEMLGYGDVLESGTTLNVDVPALQDDGVLWSGSRLGQKAVVRTFKQGSGNTTVIVEPWPGIKMTLKATPAGHTYVMELKDGTAHVTE